MVLGLVALFAGWILYRLLVKKDLARHMNMVYLGLAFIAIWGVLYVWLWA